MSLLQNSNAISAGGYNLESSLRFRDSSAASLTRTPLSGSAGTTMTLSCWIKRGKLNHNCAILEAYADGSNFAMMGINGDRPLFYSIISGTDYGYQWSNQLRDTSAWYHLVWTIDTTNAVTADRIRLYVNGDRITSIVTNWGDAPLNYATPILTPSWTLSLGRRLQTASSIDGYLSEVNFVDGQALTPSDFGETDTTTGVWKPKQYLGTYGTNGFYLPMKETQQATGFNTVLWEGVNGTNKIDNVGFQPDFIWLKSRDNTYSHYLYDSVRGAQQRLRLPNTDAEITASGVTSFDSNGFSLGTAAGEDGTGLNYVAWCWDAGSSTVSNTDGDITASVRANPDTGFSIATYTGNNTASTIGHGLGTTPSMIILKQRTAAAGDVDRQWVVGHNSIGWTKSLKLSTTDAELTSTPIWNDTAPTSSVFTIGTSNTINYTNSTYVAYCFSEVSGFSKFGSYTGTGASGNSVTGLGFRPAFLMIKRTDAGGSWIMLDNTRSPDNSPGEYLFANASDVEGVTTVVDFDSDGFTINATGGTTNGSGGTYIYMAFADTRDAQFNFDASGNKNNWTANNINSNASSETTYDIMNDVATLTNEDTANYPVCNPLRGDDFNATYSNGNMTATLGGSSVTGMGTANWHIPTSGKWFWEVTIGNFSQWCALGIRKANATLSDWLGYTANDYSISQPSNSKHNDITYDSSYTNTNIATGDVFGVAFDADNGTLKFYQNGADLGTAFTGLTDEYVPAFSGSSSVTQTLNFGQQPFRYSMPTGYKKLNTYNLPDSTIKDGSQYMNTVTYTGDGGSARALTGVGFSPDFSWFKGRDVTYAHQLVDSVRGAGYPLFSNLTNAEAFYGTVNSFDSDGVTLNASTYAGTNGNGTSFVSWHWRGSDSTAVSNTDGTITSTVSANTTSGFSIVNYTGNGTAGATVGHGLGVAPDVIIFKNRDITSDWHMYHSARANANNTLMYLNTTSAGGSTSAFLNNTDPSSTVITLGTSAGTNGSSTNCMIAYCFAEVEGYSKFGSYTGNGSADGTFVYTGFRPSFVLTKSATEARNWVIIDTTRDPNNLADQNLEPNTNNAEFTNADDLDILSNGFKPRTANPGANGNGQTIIYMAFAENPFKYSLAR